MCLSAKQLVNKHLTKWLHMVKQQQQQKYEKEQKSVERAHTRAIVGI